MPVTILLLLVMLLTVKAHAAGCCPTSEGYKHDVTSGLCVILLPDQRNWTHSAEFCDHRGDRLVSLNTSAKHTYFKSIVSSDSFWLGGHVTTEGQWGWSEDVLVSGSGWAPGQPDGSGPCMVVGTWFNFDWDDAPCHKTMGVACERVMDKTPSAECPNISSSSVITETTHMISQSLASIDGTERIAVTSKCCDVSSLSAGTPLQDLRSITPVLSTSALGITSDISTITRPESSGLSIPQDMTLGGSGWSVEISKELNSKPYQITSRSEIEVSSTNPMPLKTSDHDRTVSLLEGSLATVDTVTQLDVSATLESSAVSISHDITLTLAGSGWSMEIPKEMSSKPYQITSRQGSEIEVSSTNPMQLKTSDHDRTVSLLEGSLATVDTVTQLDVSATLESSGVSIPHDMTLTLGGSGWSMEIPKEISSKPYQITSRQGSEIEVSSTNPMQFKTSDQDSTVSLLEGSLATVDRSQLTVTQLDDSALLDISHQSITGLETTYLPTPTSTSASRISCRCFCNAKNLSTHDLELILAEIRERLLLDKWKLSKTLDKYRSVPDERRSSVSIGSVGITVLVVVVCLIVIGDLDYVGRIIHKKKSRDKNHS